MAEPLKIKVDFDGNANAILQFIDETREGKYTELKPDPTQVTLKRLQIHEQDSSDPYNIDNEDLLLGLSF